MFKKLFAQYLPQLLALKQHPQLQFFGSFLHHPQLWHFNRRTLAVGMGIGLFAAFLPMPLQMLPAAALSILFRANLPVAVSLVWITNPITTPPIAYIAYLLGAWFLNEDVHIDVFQFSPAWFIETMGQVWLPFLVGSFMMSIVSGLLGYMGVKLAWRLYIMRAWKKRHMKRARLA